jgi:hypothetical protein
MENGIAVLDKARAKKAASSANVRALMLAINAVALGFGFDVKVAGFMDRTLRIEWVFMKRGQDDVSYHCAADCSPLFAIQDCIMNFRRAGEVPLNG